MGGGRFLKFFQKKIFHISCVNANPTTLGYRLVFCQNHLASSWSVLSIFVDFLKIYFVTLSVISYHHRAKEFTYFLSLASYRGRGKLTELGEGDLS
jgi:hypothetical protein